MSGEGQFVSSTRAGLPPKHNVETPTLRRLLFVTGALDKEREKFEGLVRNLGERDDEDVVHPIDPIGSVDPMRVDDHLAQPLKRHTGILIGMCAASIDCHSRVQQVEKLTIETAKRYGRKVVLLFQDPDHLVTSPTTGLWGEAVDVVVLNDVVFAASPKKWQAAAWELFPNAEVLIALTTYGGNAARSEIDRMLGVPAE